MKVFRHIIFLIHYILDQDLHHISFFQDDLLQKNKMVNYVVLDQNMKELHIIDYFHILLFDYNCIFYHNLKLFPWYFFFLGYYKNDNSTVDDLTKEISLFNMHKIHLKRNRLGSIFLFKSSKYSLSVFK